MRSTSVGYAVGVMVLAASAFMYARASVSQSDSYTEPLVTPVSFAAGSVRTFQITTKLDRNFELAIDIEQSRLRAQPITTDMAWQIVDSDSVVADGSSLDKPWQNWWGTFEQILGNFPGRIGHHYTLTLRVNDGTPQLDSASPILKVRIPRDDWEGYGAGVAIEKLEAGTLGFVGLIVIGISFQLRRRAQKRRAGGHEPDAKTEVTS
jgi:hypothetical protein